MQSIVNGILTNYEVLGSKNKDTILILHGWGRNLQDWLPTTQFLSKTYKVILADLPGFGGSPLPSNKIMDLYDYSDWLESLLHKLGLNQIILVGHSFGGKIAVVASVTNINIKKLILVDPSGVPDKNLSAKIKEVLFQLTQPLNNILPSTIKKLLFNIIASSDYKNANSGLRQVLKKILKQNILSEASNISIPTIIIWGSEDKDVPVQLAKVLKSKIKDSLIRIVWGAGHHPHLEKPDKFQEILSDYI